MSMPPTRINRFVKPAALAIIDKVHRVFVNAIVNGQIEAIDNIRRQPTIAESVFDGRTPQTCHHFVIVEFVAIIHTLGRCNVRNTSCVSLVNGSHNVGISSLEKGQTRLVGRDHQWERRRFQPSCRNHVLRWHNERNKIRMRLDKGSSCLNCRSFFLVVHVIFQHNNSTKVGIACLIHERSEKLNLGSSITCLAKDAEWNWNLNSIQAKFLHIAKVVNCIIRLCFFQRQGLSSCCPWSGNKCTHESDGANRCFRQNLVCLAL
mmetsp:Transcript_20440/g.37093  ORF Transcript_20440/g.37093 Transcript_20440/m.37093 type:complete len:262 (+) Transcript_20440:660-1445(+)